MIFDIILIFFPFSFQSKAITDNVAFLVGTGLAGLALCCCLIGIAVVTYKCVVTTPTKSSRARSRTRSKTNNTPMKETVTLEHETTKDDDNDDVVYGVDCKCIFIEFF